MILCFSPGRPEALTGRCDREMVVQTNRWLVVVALRVVVLAIVFFSVQAASAQTAADSANATCLGCHGTPGFAPRVPADQFANSIHGDAGLRCTDCHMSITETPHKNLPATAAAREQARLAINKNCGNCHAKAAQGYLETY